MQNQLSKIGAIRRQVRGTPCPFCGGYTYHLVLRTVSTTEEPGIFSRCSHCHHQGRLDDEFWDVLWM